MIFKYYLAEVETWIGETNWCEDYKNSLKKQFVVAIPISTKPVKRVEGFEYQDIEQAGLKIYQNTGEEPENFSIAPITII